MNEPRTAQESQYFRRCPAAAESDPGILREFDDPGETWPTHQNRHLV
jgi:hypothetical protein